EERPEASLELATAALLIEVSRADFDVSEEERASIEEQVRKSFGLTEEQTREIVVLAEEEVARAVSLYEFTRLVDRSFTPDQKRHIIGLLWEVALSDERIEGREEHLIRKVATLLHVPHEAFIAEKIAARDRRK
ncbi:MAG TPA: TerB family tellurite resistance protein, partial [Vicinamibacteria bacterium]|nr:TerB family tellurite resistance protein [Vicinamibacteria bacterium]